MQTIREAIADAVIEGLGQVDMVEEIDRDGETVTRIWADAHQAPIEIGADSLVIPDWLGEVEQAIRLDVAAVLQDLSEEE
jgi:hypothetical protein